MNELFGIPLDTLLVILGVLVALAAGVLGILSLRNPVLARLGARNVPRRRARSALIVLGLMLGTTIIAAALTTGDTMSYTIRSTATQAYGETDEIVSARGAAEDVSGELGQATGTAYFDESIADRVRARLAGTDLADGVTGAIVEQGALQAPRTRRTEPTVVVFAPDPDHLDGFASIDDVKGGTVSLASLTPGQILLNERAAEKLGAARGDKLSMFLGPSKRTVRIQAIVRFDGSGTADAALLVPLQEAQRLYGQPGRIKHVLVSNRGPGDEGLGLSQDVVDRLAPVTGPLGLEVTTAKQDAADSAEEIGTAFMAFFTTFGTFSIAAGILLIFLIFVMLAAERRGELGIARAVGTRRGHLVQMFTFEGAVYDLIAAAIGTLLGAAVAFGMVKIMASALGAEDADAGLRVHFHVTAQSLLVAFGIGALLTLAVVAFSAWRVSVMTISTAIRNLPEPPSGSKKRRLLLAVVAIALGLLLAVSGVAGDQATPLMLGVSIFLIGLVPVFRVLGVPERIAYTACGGTMAVLLMLPWSWWEAVFGQIAMDFSTWIVAGLMVVVGVVWVIVYNSDILLGGIALVASHFGRLAPVTRMAVTYPLRARFRTGATLAMFTLVVFTLVTGTASSNSFTAAFDDVDKYGGGFDVRAGTTATAPITDMWSALRTTPGVDSSDFAAVGSQSILSVEARQAGVARPAENYVVRGLDRSFLNNTSLEFGTMARGYESPREVWTALAMNPKLAVVDAYVAPRRDNFGFNVPPDFQLSGFYADEGAFDPVPITVRDAQTGRAVRLTVIGVLSDAAPEEMVGISTSQATLERAFPGRALPTIHYFKLAPGVDAKDTAARLESAFLANGMEAQSMVEALDDLVAGNRLMNNLILAFMGLGLVVGVAALGVISARAVVERRQQIGVMRAIGFRRGMVQGAFLIESSFIALTSIVVGTILGLILAYEIILDSRKQPSWSGMELVVPWGTLAVIFAVVYAVALLATLAPAFRAARVRPAEALRYQ